MREKDPPSMTAFGWEYHLQQASWGFIAIVVARNVDVAWVFALVVMMWMIGAFSFRIAENWKRLFREEQARHWNTLGMMVDHVHDRGGAISEKEIAVLSMMRN